MSKTNLCMFISCFHVGCYRTPEKGRSKTPFILFFFFFFFFFLRGGEFRNTAEGMTLFVVVFLCLFLFLHNVFIVSIPPPLFVVVVVVVYTIVSFSVFTSLIDTAFQAYRKQVHTQ